VGLGNPGSRYESTRHNAGAMFVNRLAARFKVDLAERSKFRGKVGRGDILGRDLHLAIPSTFMNLSGDCVLALSRFYRFSPGEIIIAHDEMAFSAGQIRIKSGGGDNGHNGIKHIIACLGQNDFSRLRIGVGHPGDKGSVNSYLTTETPSALERVLIEDCFEFSDAILGQLLVGNFQEAMNALHSPKET